jgi:CHASE3 domain sensor protein
MNIPTGAARRVVVASSIVGLLVVIATIVTISRFDNANDNADAALAATSSAVTTGDAVTAFWRERETMNEYLLTRSQALLDELADGRAEFESKVRSAADDEGELPLVNRSIAGNTAFIRTFASVRGAGSSSDAGLEPLNAAEGRVLEPLAALAKAA